MRLVCPALLAASLFVAACGGQAPPAEPPIAAAPAPEPAPAPSAASAEPATPAPPDAAADSDVPAVAPPRSEPDPNATREVTYVVVPEGLKVSVAGVRFAVSASAVQVASG